MQMKTTQRRTQRPKLTAETVVKYLEWIAENVGNLSAQETKVHMEAAELVVRTMATKAQAKDTQHTLVRDGLMDAPTV
jgi:hypothetical protein